MEWVPVPGNAPWLIMGWPMVCTMDHPRNAYDWGKMGAVLVLSVQGRIVACTTTWTLASPQCRGQSTSGFHGPETDIACAKEIAERREVFGEIQVA